MFQTFDETVDFSQSARRVEHLRRLLADEGLDGFVVPRADEHQGEYIPPSAARLAWLTGFTGSAGVAVVLASKAFVLVDGRYTVQVRDQVDLSVFEPRSSVETPLVEFLGVEAKGLRIAVDPWLHTLGEVAALRTALEAGGGSLVELGANPIDRAWNDRPTPPKGAVSVHPERYSGRAAADKLRDIEAAIEKAGADATVLTDPSSIAWTFNIRGADVAHTPLPLAFAILHRGRTAQLFIDADKLGPEARAHLEPLAAIEAPEAFEPALKALGETAVMLDPGLAAARIATLVEAAGGRVVKGADPARLPRAIKNEAEIAGSRAAHLRDGAAVTAFLHWLDGTAPGSVGEIEAAQKLEAFRAEFGEADGMALRDISFDTIAGSGPNGAIVHYRVNRDTDRKLGQGELFLIDSGAQYLDGTTDITRTVPIGAPTDEMRRAFTLVLKGMIAISTARFPKGTRGLDLDPLARIALWKAGLDYAHGTGHGVGSYLAVHEGPQSISRRGAAVIEPGMMLSNEPGYYREGAFGIRIENLVLTLAPEAIEGGEQPMLGFETLTFAPIDRRLIDPALLTGEERGWLDAYHARVADRLSPVLADHPAAGWLAEMTRPIGG
ncbi:MULTISPECIES: aminopeptidase P family protein [unclassified Aureimonas]|uniref:aminopeptidase P family protein n=1 Tax=unclassified Aureimonas TaxID=2615206 RepID=UPI0006F7B75E|nr:MULTISPECIES: aminopeptidase P family protein [unclassified Aureimonas]KQT52858.1 X-Pro aminopeptidase [Aureimonas sp. Leaf427]KQT80317.1 X-Pro aminopeptidase [Aureimonas sp. Leaf460]